MNESELNETTEPVDPTEEPVREPSRALKLMGKVIRGTLYGVAICFAGLLALALLLPPSSHGAKSSTRLEWEQRQADIEKAIPLQSADHPQPPEQP